MTLFPRRAFLGLAVTAFSTPHGLSLAANFSEVAAPIVALNSGLMEAMQAGPHLSFQQRFDRLAPDIDRAFDLTDILRLSIGLVYPNLLETERDALLAVFRRFTIASYVANFDRFDGERFEVLPELREIGQDQVVSTRITPATGQPIRLDYVMRKTEAGWRAIDVLMDGTISRVAVQRSDFRALLTQGSGSQVTAQPLIASLRKKVLDLSGGQLASG